LVSSTNQYVVTDLSSSPSISHILAGLEVPFSSLIILKQLGTGKNREKKNSN